MLGLDIFEEHAKDFPNVYFDISRFERVRRRDILEAIRLFGPEHVIFGTDTPYAGMEDRIVKIDQPGPTDRVKEQIFRTNIRKESCLIEIHIGMMRIDSNDTVKGLSCLK